MTAHRHTANLKTGRRTGGRKNNALACSIPPALLSRTAGLHCRARGSSLAPTGRHSFTEDADDRDDSTIQHAHCWPANTTGATGMERQGIHGARR